MPLPKRNPVAITHSSQVVVGRMYVRRRQGSLEGAVCFICFACLPEVLGMTFAWRRAHASGLYWNAGILKCVLLSAAFIAHIGMLL